MKQWLISFAFGLILGIGGLLTISQSAWAQANPADDLVNQQHGDPRNQPWGDFATNVTKDQFPWETLVNRWLFSGNRSAPPHQQLRLLHPVPLIIGMKAEKEENGASVNPRMGMELLGYRHYDRDNRYTPLWGLSLITALRADTDNGHGMGILIGLEKFSFGVIAQENRYDKRELRIVVGTNLSHLLNNEAQGLRDSRGLVER